MNPAATRKNLSGAICLIGQPLLLNVLSIPATAYIIRALGPLGYGQWAVGVSLVGSAIILTNLGLRTLFVRSVAQNPDGAETALAEQLGIRGGLALVASGAAMLLCWTLGYPRIVLACTGIAAFGMVLTALACTIADLLQGFECFKEFTIVSLTAGLVLTLTSVLAVWRGAGPIGLSIAYLTGPATSLVLFFEIVRKRYFRPKVRWNIKRFTQMLSEAHTIGGQQILSTLQDRTEQLLVPKMVGIAAFGYFSAGIMLSTRMAYVPDGLSTAFYPLISKSYRQNERMAAWQITRLLVLSLVVCVPLAMLMMFLAPPIAAVLFPRTARVCRSVIEITIWAVPLLGISLPMNYSLQASGRHSEAAKHGIRATFCSMAVSLVLISRFGVIGACASWVVRPALSILFLLPCFMRSFPEVVSALPLGRILACGGVMALLLSVVSLPQLSPLASAGLPACLATLAYGAALLLLRVVQTSELARLLNRKGTAPADRG